ncbi:MAG TPA: hypothetical protein VF584_06720 [Longimicrobium sp.]|jgi:hypothetical protein
MTAIIAPTLRTGRPGDADDRSQVKNPEPDRGNHRGGGERDILPGPDPTPPWKKDRPERDKDPNRESS